MCSINHPVQNGVVQISNMKNRWVWHGVCIVAWSNMWNKTPLSSLRGGQRSSLDGSAWPRAFHTSMCVLPSYLNTLTHIEECVKWKMVVFIKLVKDCRAKIGTWCNNECTYKWAPPNLYQEVLLLYPGNQHNLNDWIGLENKTSE